MFSSIWVLCSLKKKSNYLLPYYWMSFLYILNINPVLNLCFINFPLIQKIVFSTRELFLCWGRDFSFDVMPLVYFCFCWLLWVYVFINHQEKHQEVCSLCFLLVVLTVQILLFTSLIQAWDVVQQESPYLACVNLCVHSHAILQNKIYNQFYVNFHV